MLDEIEHVTHVGHVTHVQNDNISCCFFHFIKVFIFLIVGRLKEQKMAENDKKWSVTLHISGSMHHMMLLVVQKCKMITSPDFFSFFQNFYFLVVRGSKCKKWPKMTKYCLLHSLSLWSMYHMMSFVVQKCKSIKSPDFFSHFFKIFIFWIARRVKGEKMAQNDKNFVCRALCLRKHNSWSSFMVHMCKRIFFSNFNFQGC